MEGSATTTPGGPGHDGPRLALELPLVLPEVRDCRDQCVDRLIESLHGLRGITTAHVDGASDEARLCLHYDADLVSLGQVERLAQDAGARVAARYRHETIRIPDMDCGDCAQSIEHVMGRVPGVLSCAVSYGAETMHVEFDSTRLVRDDIVSRLRSMGYEARSPEVEPTRWIERHDDLARAIGSGAALAVAWLAERAGASPFLFGPLYALSALAGGWEVFQHGFAAAPQGSFTIDFLMSLGAVGAALLGHWADGALLLFLFCLGHAAEEEAFAKARNAIGALGAVAPRSASVLRSGAVVERPVEEIERGDVVRVRAGERIPVDGTVRAGRSDADESAITGDSVPVPKSPGDPVLAVPVNGLGALEVEATKLATETTIARMMRLVEEAEGHNAPTQALVDRVSSVLVPMALAAVAAMAILVPLSGGLSWTEAFLRATAMLVAASPCALAIATPAAVLAAIARAGRRGVLVKGGLHLETLGRLRAIAFDKTGTITTGRPEVVEVLPAPGVTEERLLSVAAAVERRSTHPIARAVAARAATAGAPELEAARVEVQDGLGLRGDVEGEPAWIGNRELFASRGMTLPADLDAALGAAEARGWTAVAAWHAGRPLGTLAVVDRPRPTAAATVARLHEIGVDQVSMLTGDQPRVAREIASVVGIADVHAALHPEQKLDAVRDLQRRHGATAMVGDGVNDAPALATADVGIAMGAAGSDAA
ncbi:MAG: heavy metal translocating P-type ATPase, partial [Alphaproteobacteria bacterium]